MRIKQRRSGLLELKYKLALFSEKTGAPKHKFDLYLHSCDLENEGKVTKA